MKHLRTIRLAACVLALFGLVCATEAGEARRVLNLVNFVRGCEPRSDANAEHLDEPLREEIARNTKYGFRNTILLQYDALLRDDLVTLAKTAQQDRTEYGVWVEMCRQLVEKCGGTWQSRNGWDWDWFVKPGFLMAYEPAMREKICDELFRLFKERFGAYPKTMGSWMLDAHSMDYVQTKYGVKAFLICREQDATDAYTLNGGYFNGAYYPSKKNALSAAVDMRNAIKAPVFRMLTPDPIYNYGTYANAGFNTYTAAGCPTMEPTGNPNVPWYFRLYGEPVAPLNLSYMQTGQENSFYWSRIHKSLDEQLAMAAKYAAEGKIAIETVAETAERFMRDHSENCPQTQIALEDRTGAPRQSVWYNSKHYRANLFLEDGALRFRDIHVMDDNDREDWLERPCPHWDAEYHTPAVVDEKRLPNSGLLLLGKYGSLACTSDGEKTLRVTAKREDGAVVTVSFDEGRLVIAGAALTNANIQAAANLKAYEAGAGDYDFTRTRPVLPRAATPQMPDAKWTWNWWKSRHEQKLAEIKKHGGADVVFIGDSITQLWESPDYGKSVWDKYFQWEKPYRTLNLGYSGDRTEHVLWRIQHGELDGYAAKVIVLLIGTNNTGHFPIEKEPPEATILGYQAVVRAIRNRQPTAKLVLGAIFPCDHAADGPRRLRNEIVNKEIRKLADNRDIFWVDCTTQFLTTGGELRGEVMGDRLHPGPLGYEIWTSAILPYINYALTVPSSCKFLYPSTFAPYMKSETTWPHTLAAYPIATFGERWWGEFADRPLETMGKIAANEGREYDLVMVGDSITHRLERPGQGGDRMWAQLTNEYACLNLGYGGDTTANCLWRMRYGELYGYKAKVITVLIGVNNGAKPDTARGIEAVVKEIRKLHPESKIVVMPILPRMKSADNRFRKEEVKLSAEARKYIGEKDVTWLDINARFLNADGTLKEGLLMKDDLHLDEKGYQIWYEALKPILKDVIGH